MKRLLFLMVIGMVFAFGAVTHAGEATGDLNVTATALEVCSVTTSPIPFGSYTEDEVRVNGSVIVTCTKGKQYRIGLDEGARFEGGPLRQMYDGKGNRLQYKIYKPNGTNLWGNINEGGVAPGNSLGSLTGTGGAQPHKAIGQLIGSQPVPPGDYHDEVGVTVYY